MSLYTLTGTFTRADLTPIGSTQTQVVDEKDAMVSAALDATAPAGSELVVEIHPPVDSGNLLKGTKYTHNFTAPGTYNYHCSIHPNMVGQIQVNP